MSAPLPAAGATGPHGLRFGECEIDLSAQRLRRGGTSVPLQPRYFAVLVHLAGSAGRLVTKDELLDTVWGHRHVSDSVLKVAINAVRAALGDDPKAPRHIETVPRRGYRFLAGAHGAGEAPVSATAAVVSPLVGNLPPPPADLVGREADLQRLHEALAEQRLITLHGPGGVGKTRLALVAAGHAPPPDGVWLVRLDALSAELPLLSTVARTLGLGSGAEASPAALARGMSGQRLRLVLDNAEHLLPAVADLVSAVRAGAPGVQLLVTSQVPLHVAGEQVLPVAPLELPGERLDLAEGPPAAALQLLLQRVHQLEPDQPFDADDARHAAAICRSLDGLPLALELAAARVPLLGWSGVRMRLDERLGERLQLLTRGPRDAPERHRTLRAALAWTHGLLSPLDQRVLAALSVFAGSFTLEAALAVANLNGSVDGTDAADPTDALLDALDSLRDRSLLVRAGDAAGRRWRLYDSVRSFAAESLAAGPDAEPVQQRFLQRQIDLFLQVEHDFARTAQRPWLARWQPEADNLWAALQLAHGQPGLRLAGARLYALCSNFCARGGWRRQALLQHTRFSPCAADATPELRALLDLAEACLSSIGQLLPPRPALQAAWRAATYFEQAGDLRLRHQALYHVSALMMRLQAPVAERAEVQATMRAMEPADWGPMQRRNRVWQDVMLARQQGDMAQFEERCAAYMATGRALGDESAAWVASQALAQAMAGAQRLDTAVALLERTVREMRAAGELRQNGHVLAQYAALRIVQDADPDSVAALHEAARLLQADDRLWWMADALAWLPARQGRWADALRVQAWADGLVRQRGDQRGLLFGTVRERFERFVAARPMSAPAEVELPGLDESAVLALVFSPVG